MKSEDGWGSWEVDAVRFVPLSAITRVEGFVK